MNSFAIVNGQRVQIPNGSEVSIVGSKLYIDGKEYKADGSEPLISITIEGDVGSLKVDKGDVSVLGSVNGNVEAGGSVGCGQVDGHVVAGGSITCGNIDGPVDSGGSVNCMNIEGSVDAGGSVRYSKETDDGNGTLR